MGKFKILFSSINKIFPLFLPYQKKFLHSQNIETQPKSSLLKKEISIEEQLLGKDFSDYQLNRLKQIFETSAWHLENYDKCEKKQSKPRFQT